MFKKILVSLSVIVLILSICPDISACQLLGASFSEKAQANHLWQAFRLRGKINNDGWGLAYYPDNAVQIFKEPTDASKSKLAAFLDTYPLMESEIFITHLRKASVGSRHFQNTHPFVRYYRGSSYVLIHNGTLRNFRSKLKLGCFRPIGKTDSEYLLCYLLGKIADRKMEKWTKNDFLWLNSLLQQINDTGSLNCIFSNGRYLFCYHDKNDYNTLFYIYRHRPSNTVVFTDIHQQINLSKLYDLSDMFVIATKPLTNEKWHALAKGSLIVAEKGKIIFGANKPNK